MKQKYILTGSKPAKLPSELWPRPAYLMYARRHIYANGIVTQMYDRQPCAGYLNGRALVTCLIHTNFVDGNTCPWWHLYLKNTILILWIKYSHSQSFYNILSSWIRWRCRILHSQCIFLIFTRVEFVYDWKIQQQINKKVKLRIFYIFYTYES